MDNSPPPSIQDARLLELSSKIVVLCIIVVFIVLALIILLTIYSRFYLSCFAYEDPSIVAWRRRTAASGDDGPPANRRGLGIEALESLPVIVYDPKDFKDGLECSVCLSEVTQGERARLLPKCNHGFHADCIDVWFQSHSTCPLCRSPVITMDGSNSIRIEIGDYSGEESSSSSDEDDGDGSFHSTSEGSFPLFPTNVLVWGNQAQVSSSGLSSEGRGEPAAGSSSGSPSPSGDMGQCGESVVVDIPTKENCSSGSPSPATPVMTRVKSLKRLLSRGKRVVPPASSSSEPAADVQV